MKARRVGLLAMASIGYVACIVIGSGPDYNPFTHWVTQMHDVCDAEDDKAAFMEFMGVLREFGAQITFVQGDRIVVGHGCRVLVNTTKDNEVEIRHSINNPTPKQEPTGDAKEDMRLLQKALQDSTKDEVYRVPGEAFVRYVTSNGVFESIAADQLSDAVILIRNGDRLMIVDVAEGMFSRLTLGTKSP